MIIAIAIYAAAMTIANVLIGQLGPWISPVSSFFLIGLTLSLRDWLHVRMKPWQMLVLICVSGALTYLLNPALKQIAIASAASFTLAAIADWITFANISGVWLKRSNVSNTVGSAVDSIVFPTMAFGVLMPDVIAAQFAAKMMGGFVWSYAIHKFNWFALAKAIRARGDQDGTR